jgi:PAS domain S-box-containing protein
MLEKLTYEELEQRVKELEESEKKYRDLFETALVGIYRTRISDGKFLAANETMARMMGYESVDKIIEECIVSEQYADPDPNRRKELLTQLKEVGKVDNFEIEMKRRDGSHIQIALSATIYPELGYLEGVIVDITNLKRTEKALRESEEKYKTLIENAGQIIMVAQDFKIKYINRRVVDLFGYKPEEVSESLFLEYIHPDDRKMVSERYQKRLEGDNFPQVYSFRAIDKTGEIKWLEIYAVLIEWEGRLATLNFLSDITERKQAQIELLESQEKYQRLFEMESDAIFLIDNETGNILEVNKAASDIYGYTREELLNRKNTDISAKPDVIRRATKTALRAVPIGYHEKKNGDVFPVEVTTSHFIWKGRDVHIAAIRDISSRLEAEEEKRRLENKLSQAQKMEAIGTLAGGIAHDFNNILTPIMAHSDLAAMQLSPDSPVQDNIRYINKAGERARDLVKQILSFARSREKDKIPLNPFPIVKEAIKFMRSAIPTTIDIQYDSDTEKGTILADPTQVNQIIMNLCNNAAQAMRQKGGVVKIKLDSVYIGLDKIKYFSGLEPGNYFRLTVSDSGPGISPDIQDKIFEPYFTTKATGDGTGLGLAVVHGIVKDCGGDVVIESELGKGATFHVMLPLMEEATSPVTEAKVDLPMGKERVLVIDDEISTLETIQQMLEILGYKVTVRTSSIEALAAFRNNPDRFDLVITDQTMPNMTGKELAGEVLAIRPNIPIILSTGFSEQIDERTASRMGIRAFVMKPVILSELSQTLRKILDER